MNASRALSVLATLFVTSSVALRASAFCRATTCDPTKADANCMADVHGCLSVGAPLAWASDCVTVDVQAAGAPQQHIDFDAARASVERAFAAWTNARCAGGKPAITVDVAGPITCATSEYNSTQANANIVLFREDEWPYVGGQDALGVTFISFDPKTGEIWDADIEVNAVDEPLSVGNPTPNQVDLDSLLTHEAGHLLGLTHTLDTTATMFAGYKRGTTGLRTLAADDVSGICSVYPPSRAASSTSCVPRHGFSDLCSANQPAAPIEGADDVMHSSSCAAVNGSHRRASPLGALLGLGVALTALRRARRSA